MKSTTPIPLQQRAVRRHEAPAAGSIVSGRYHLLEELGQGGMATVFRALDLELDEEIALKLFTEDRSSPSAQLRFKKELVLARGLAHENIVRLFDMGAHGNAKFITMELLRGRNVGELIAEGPLEVHEGVELVRQICAGLQQAHERHIVHRDIKPENLFVTDRGTLKIMDFGIAKAPTAPGLTVAGQTLGTPEYMSPEQIQDFGSVGPRSDLYSLGCVMYEMFTQRVPFEGSELIGLLNMHATRSPSSPRTWNSTIPSSLDEIILHLLEKEPDERFQSCAELERRLRLVRHDIG